MSAVAVPAAAALPAAARDFDFLFGRWKVHSERLRRRLADCSEWESFAAQAECRPLPGGLGNVETFQTDWQGGFCGVALRLFEPARGEWAIHWAGSRDGRLEPAVRGGFTAGVGVFLGPDQHEGRAVLARYRWSRIEADRATWDQAWSVDGGASWEANWVMQFSRSGAPDHGR
jgi:hypothetical protein